jgi:hypothetical protein
MAWAMAGGSGVAGAGSVSGADVGVNVGAAGRNPPDTGSVQDEALHATRISAIQAMAPIRLRGYRRVYTGKYLDN